MKTKVLIIFIAVLFLSGCGAKKELDDLKKQLDLANQTINKLRETFASESQAWQQQTSVLADKLSDGLDKIDPVSLKLLFKERKSLEEYNNSLEEKLKSIENIVLHSNLRVEGKCSGNPYLNLEVYIDNPPDSDTGKPLKKETPIFKISTGTTGKTFQVDIPNKYYTVGSHSLDVYVGYPGDNDAFVDLKLVPVKQDGSSQNPIKIYHVNNTSHNNIGPHWPKHRISFPFNLKAE